MSRKGPKASLQPGASARSPHPATVIQPKRPIAPASTKRPPHPATVIRPRRPWRVAIPERSGHSAALATAQRMEATKEEEVGLEQDPDSRRYREIRQKYDPLLALNALDQYKQGNVLSCTALAQSINRKSTVCIQMMMDVQSRGDLRCSFQFQPATTLCESLKLKLKGTARWDDFNEPQLQEAFARHVSLLHVTSGGLSLKAFLLQEGQKKASGVEPLDVELGDSESILVPNYVCQVFIEHLFARTFSSPIKLGSTNEKDWVLFGNNMSVFFSLAVNGKLIKNNSGQTDWTKKAVFKNFCDFANMAFWMGPDLLSLSKAHEKNPKDVERIIAQTVAPHGSPHELLELLYWRAVASKYPAIDKNDIEAGTENLLHIITATNGLNLSGVKSGCDGWSDIQDANKLELKALGLVTGIQKEALGSLKNLLTFIPPRR